VAGLPGGLRRRRAPLLGHAPWYVVPADNRWYRKWAVARLLIETLAEMDPKYPVPGFDVEALKARLGPPN
jgi:Uncharacterized conserved protein